MKHTPKRFLTMIVSLLCFSLLPVCSFSEEAADVPDMTAAVEETFAEDEPIEILPTPEPDVYSMNYIKPEPEAPVITQQPQDIGVKAGESAWFSVSAEGKGLTYMWQALAPYGEWIDLGCTEQVLCFTASAEQDGFCFRCVVSSMGVGSVISETAVLSVAAFPIVDGIIYENTLNGLRIVGVSTAKKNIVIPETVNGLTVREVGPSAFENQTMLESIDLPDTIEIIGARAFAGCKNLSSMS